MAKAQEKFTDTTQTKEESALFAGHLIATGKVVKLNHALPELDERVIDDNEIDNEIKKFKEAVADSILQLEEIIEEAEIYLPKDIREEFTKILTAQIGMLGSKSTSKEIEDAITKNKKPAATAVHVALNKKSEYFSKQDNPIQKAKEDDAKALRDRLIRNILEIPHPSLDNIPEDKIIVIDSLAPAEAIYLYKKRPLGLLLASGSPSGHVGDLCAGLHIPCAFLLSDSDAYEHVKEGNYLILDGLSSKIIMRPTKEQRDEALKKAEWIKQRKETLKPYEDGEEFHAQKYKLDVAGTVGVSTEVSELNRIGANGVSLYRTEAALLNGQTPPNAEEQIKKVYTPILQQWKRNEHHLDNPIIFRTYDLEGDKRPNRNITIEEKREILKEQMGAIMDASIRNDVPVKIMVPNIRTYEELVEARAIFDEAYEERKDKMPIKPEFGMMLEIPNMTTTFNLERSKDLIDFMSVGTNDLPARMLAAGRDNANDQVYLDPTNPAILGLYAEIIDFCESNKIPLSFCGGQATNEEYTALFMGLGAKSISARHGSFTEIRHAISKINPEKATLLVDEIMNTLTRSEREKLLNDFNRELDIGVSKLLANDNKAPAPALRA